MSPQFFETKLIEKKKLTEDVYEFIFEMVKPSEIDFQAGQFVNIRVDDGNEKKLFRSYSILSPPREKKVIKSCVKILENGRCSKWLEKSPIGTPVTCMGPIGLFIFKKNSAKDVLFVATGTGITPLHSMIIDELEQGNTTPMHLLWGFRYEKDIFYKKLFEKLSKKYPNFHLTLTLSHPEQKLTESRSIGHEQSAPFSKGRVTEYLEKNFPDSSNTQIYICGIGKMVLDVKNLCIAKGVHSKDIHFERYT